MKSVFSILFLAILFISCSETTNKKVEQNNSPRFIATNFYIDYNDQIKSAIEKNNFFLKILLFSQFF